MSYVTEFNWILKLKPEQGIDEDKLTIDKKYSFSKVGHRNYPLDVPIDLVNNDWQAIAKVVITNFSVQKNETTGSYTVLKIYEGQEKQVLTKYWRECLEYVKGKQNDYSNVKIS